MYIKEVEPLVKTWYSVQGIKRYNLIGLNDVQQEQLALYYEMLFAKHPDVLSLNEAAEITGFAAVSICRWINAKKSRVFEKQNTYLGGFIKWQEQL